MFGAETKQWAQFIIDKGFLGKHILHLALPCPLFFRNCFKKFSFVSHSLLFDQCTALEKLLKDFAGTYATGEHIYTVTSSCS